MTRFGIFGGTFDPPHLGHLVLASEAVDQLGLQRVLWVLTPNPPHKLDQSFASLDHRFEMLHVAIGGMPAFQVSTVDMDRSPPHYALDTMLLLREQYPNVELVYLIGGDSLHDLPAWHEPRKLLAACHALGVMRRAQDGVDLPVLEAALPGISARLLAIDAPNLEISSSVIRQRIAEGRPFRYFLPFGVYDFIRARRLYGYRGT